MTCQTHRWWFDIPCQKCHEQNVVEHTPLKSVDDATYTKSFSPTLRPQTPIQSGEGLKKTIEDAWEIPSFLQRDKGEKQDGLSYNTSLAGGYGRTHSDRPSPLKFWPDDKLLTALSDHTISVIDRQPILEEAKKRHDQPKGYERKKAFL